MKKYYIILILLVLSVPLFFLNLNTVHDWGDDSYQYILEARNLAQGKPFYQTTWLYNGMNNQYAPPQYPPGFPILLAPVVKIWGYATCPILCLESLLLAGILFILFFYYRKNSSTITSICLPLMIVYSSSMIDWKQDILADIPGLFFVCLYLLLRKSERLTTWKKAGLIFAGTFAILCRSQVILLPVAELLYWGITSLKQIIITRRFSSREIFRADSFVLGMSMMLVFFILNQIVFAAPMSGLSFYMGLYSSSDQTTWEMLGYNINYLLSLFQTLINHRPNDPFFQAPVNVMVYTAITFGWIGFILSLKKRLKPEDLFFLLTFLLILFTPVYQGERYLFPIFPLFILYVKEGMAATLPRAFNINAKWLAAFFILGFLALGYDDYERSTHKPGLYWTPFKPEDSAAFVYIRKKVDDKDIILFSKPRALALFTGKRSMNLAWQFSFDRNKQKIDSMQVRYMLWGTGASEQYFRDYLYQTHSCVDSTKINDLYTLYRLR